MTLCALATTCPFFERFSPRKSLLWRGILSSYCRGSSIDCCEHRRIYLRDGTFLFSNVLPTGKEASKAFLSLP